jgi:hypothetical protein
MNEHKTIMLVHNPDMLDGNPNMLDGNPNMIEHRRRARRAGNVIPIGASVCSTANSASGKRHVIMRNPASHSPHPAPLARREADAARNVMRTHGSV